MSSSKQSLAQASHGFKQFCLNCLFGSFGIDREEIVEELGLQTRNAVPMLGWDLVFTKMSAGCPGAICTKNKSGYWEYVLLYDPGSDFVFSFMRESRFDAIRKMPAHKRPLYVSALLKFANSIAAPLQQRELFVYDNISDQRKRAIAERLNAICSQFQNEGVDEIKNYACVTFTVDDGQPSSMIAHVLNTKMEVIEKDDWMASLTPDIAPVVDDIVESAKTAKTMPLTEKARQRIGKSKLVKPKINNGQAIEG